MIRITEGELKADIATALSSVLSVGLPGVGAYLLALPILEALKPTTVLISFDADFRTNTTVANALCNAIGAIRSAGFNVKVETWPSAHKGIDDLLAAGFQPRVSDPSSVAVASKTVQPNGRVLTTRERVFKARRDRINEARRTRANRLKGVVNG
jgi:hypothetical protein